MAMNTNLPALILGSTTTELATKRGAAKQVVADVAKNTLVLMDGAKNGGHPMAKEERRIISTSNALSLNGGVSADLSGDINLGFNPDAVPPTGYEAIKEAVAQAKAAGQIGYAPFLGNVDANDLTEPGVYYVRMVIDGDYNPYAKHWPRLLSARTLVLVFTENNGAIRQLVVHGAEIWARNGGVSSAWDAWVPIQIDVSTVYISKSGDDMNTGLDPAYPVLTPTRAFEIARGIMAFGRPRVIHIRWGAGDWGDIGLAWGPEYELQFQPYDGAIPYEGSSSLPRFGSITAYGGVLTVFGCVIDFLYGHSNAYITVTGGWIQVNAIWLGYGSYGKLEAYANNTFMVGQRSNNGDYFLAGFHGSRINVGKWNFKLVENVTYKFFMATAGLVDVALDPAMTFNTNGKTFTGRKIYITPGSRVSSGEGVSESGLLPVIDRMFGYSYQIMRGALLDGIAVNN